MTTPIHYETLQKAWPRYATSIDAMRRLLKKGLVAGAVLSNGRWRIPTNAVLLPDPIADAADIGTIIENYPDYCQPHHRR